MRTTNQILGQVLRETRKRRKLSQEELAHRAGLDRTYISMLELGDNSPTLNTLICLCDALQVTLTEFAAHFEEERSRPDQ